MTKLFLTLTALLSMVYLINAQDNCFTYFPHSEGTELVMKSYDDKGKEQSTLTQKILKLDISGGKHTLEVEQTTSSSGDDTEMVHQFEIICEDGVMYIDMEKYIDQQQLAPYENMDIEVDANQVEIPSNPTAGQELSDGSISVSVSSGGMPVFSIKVFITNRKVEALEQVSTPAGTFDCVKITYDIQTKIAFMNVKASSAEWYAEDAGVVRSESFNKKGKLTGYTELVEIK